MLLKMSIAIQQRATFKLLLVLAIVMLGLGYMVTSSFSPSEELKTLANGRDVPDTQISRSADDFYRQLGDYGENGRQLYLTRISPVDVFIPITQALFLSVAITLVFRRAFAPESRWQVLNLLPFMAMVGDYLENISMVVLMLAYPTRLAMLATASAIFTTVKFVFSVISVGSIVAGIVVWLIKRSRANNSRPPVG